MVPSYRSFLYRISTTGVRSSDHNKEVAAIDQRCDTTQQKTFEEENFREFQGFAAICKSFSMKFGGVAFFVKVFSTKICFPPIHESFLPRKFPAIR